ncbi:uracil-DNA glycosylase family protein [Geobacter sp. DSM 9736]|uniref:uracil-DNA glycosylase n=1 Tax=Geobacter sp. DSM 9736 TaxID=1277350 RepID=UPI000B50F6E4|nr:uracil-DNA glycosylase [Geobacter sp. DSM 9736]SNB44897.1 DNA polymerase [Geobacter sp. DSM 9736]
MAENTPALETLASLRAYLEELRDTGVEAIPLAVPLPAGAERSVPEQASVESLCSIRSDLGECGRCGLGATRTNLVFGVGNPDARLVFVGEAPGRDEDFQGEPFVGEAGQLLTKIIQAMGFSREEVYICNVLKCRPPQNRNPQPPEIEACEPFLLRQLKAISPEAVICLGTFAAQTLLRTKEPISRLRGKFHNYHGIPLMPTFHPAFLLRNPAMKREVWSDVQQVMKLLGKDQAT